MQPFQINVSQEILDDLQTRLANTRWPDEVAKTGWQYGADPDYLRQLAQYWQTDFDWQKQQDALNQFANYRTEIDGYGLHFIHEKGK
jgi:hypothetical protein